MMARSYGMTELYRELPNRPVSHSSRHQASAIKTVAFTGHRPEKLPWGNDEASSDALIYKFRLRETLEYLIGQGYVNFLSGGARGFDTIAAEMVISLREVYPWIRLMMVLPCADQADRWNLEDRKRWENIVVNSDHVETLTPVYDRGCMFRRNRYLVDHSDLILAAYDGYSNGGTAMTLEYAHRKGRKVRRLSFDGKHEYRSERSCIYGKDVQEECN